MGHVGKAAEADLDSNSFYFSNLAIEAADLFVKVALPIIILLNLCHSSEENISLHVTDLRRNGFRNRIKANAASSSGPAGTSPALLTKPPA